MKCILKAIVIFSIILISASGVWAEGLWQDNGVVICNAIEQQSSPRIISDRAGGAIIT